MNINPSLGTEILSGLNLFAGAATIEHTKANSSYDNDLYDGVIGMTFDFGPVSIGYVEGGYQPAVASGEVTYYENKFYGISFDVNDALSVSYNVDQSDKNARTAVAVGASAGTKTVTDMEQKSVQLAYTTGGATIGIAQVEVSNSDYTSGKDEAQTVVSLGISF